MSLKKLIEEITKPVIDEMGIVAGDGTIKGGSKLSKIKKMKKKGHTSVPYGSGYKKVDEIAVRPKPKKFRDIYDALPSALKKRVYNLKNYDQRRDAHPEGNVLKHTIAVTNRALKTGDIDFALSALFHDIGKDSTAKLHPKKGFWTHYGHEKVSAELVKKHATWIKSMGGDVDTIYYIVRQHMRMKVFDKMKWTKQDKMSKEKHFGKLQKFTKFDRGGRGIKEINKTLDLHRESVVYSNVDNGDSASNLKDVNEKLSRKDQIKQNKLRDERQKLIKKAIGFGSGANSHKLKLQIKDIEKQIAKLNEAKQIKKVIGVFGGRFQPFHSGHAATYDWLKGRVDEAYITTSNIKQPPRHPMNFSEKVRHMTKMGIPRNRIIQETSPYVAKNLLRKYDPETTAVVYVVGGKDSGRLGGKYFKPYTKDMKGFDEHGYILTAPQSGNISGTKARELLGDPKIDDSERQKRFKNIFGYFDKGNFQMMTNKFKKLFETYTLTDELIEEFLLEATGTPGGNLDDGPSTYYKDFEDYEKSSKNWIDNLYSGAGWKIIDYIVSNNAIDPMDNDDAPSEFSRRKPGKKHYVSTDVTHLDAGQAKGSVAAVGEYKKWMTDVVKPLGWEIVNWMGTDAAIDNIIGDLMVAGADGFSYEVKDKDNFHEQINSKSVLTQKNKGKGLLLMGGAYGHLNHPFDNNNLTFSDFRTLIINTLQGNLSNDGTVTEKTDGQNIMISWKNGKLIAARNGGHIKNFGAAALSISGVKSMFAGRGDLEKAFVGAMVDLSKAIGGLSDKQKDKIFAEGKKFMSLEIIYPKTANVIPYDKSLLQFHGTIEYNAAGSPIGSDSSSARVLAGMIKQINQNVQKTFSVTGPFVAKLPKVKNFSQRQSYFLGKLNALQNNYALRGTDTLADYHQAYWMEYILNGANQTDFMNITNDILVKLTKRWAFFDKSYKIPQIKKDLKEDHPKFLEWVLSTDKNDHARLQKEHIRDWEVLFFELGAEILKNLSDFIAANPDAAVQKIKKDLISVISKVKNSTDPKVLNTLKTQLDRLNAIGGLDAVVPSEGITFMFKGKLYKYTGAFAPVNQILGMLKFTR